MQTAPGTRANNSARSALLNHLPASAHNVRQPAHALLARATTARSPVCARGKTRSGPTVLRVLSSSCSARIVHHGYARTPVCLRIRIRSHLSHSPESVWNPIAPSNVRGADCRGGPGPGEPAGPQAGCYSAARLTQQDVWE